MQQPSRVLQVVSVMNRGGAETMIMNYYRAIDRTKLQFDFLVHYNAPGSFDEEIKKMGGHIYKAMPIRPWTYHSYFKWLDNFFKEHHEYIAVHSHIQENSGFVFKYAAKYGITKRIVNSHIADLGIDYKFIFRQFGKHFLNKYATDRFACGVDAGKFLYGEKDFIVFKNAIITERFIYNQETRNKIRFDLSIPEDAIVIGHVGRFEAQKNHTFLIDIFKEIQKENSNAILLLAGDGKLKNKIMSKVKLMGLNNSVIFLGIRPNVNEIMQAFDVLLFPSLYEGLPVSIIEAQASGLQCILSDTIDRTTDITGNCHFLSLTKSAEEWASYVLEASKSKRENTADLIKKAGYDVTENVNWLTNYYFSRK